MGPEPNVRGGFLGLFSTLFEASRQHRYEYQLFHYTTLKRISEIKTQGLIKAKYGKTYVTDRPLSPADAERNLFFNAPNKKGHGDYVVIMDAPETFVNQLTEDPSTPLGYIYPGSIRHGRHVDFMYLGPNPY